MAGQPKVDIGVELTADDEKIMRGEGVEAPAPEPAPEPAPAPEPVVEAAPEPKAEEPKAEPAPKVEDEPKFVPLAALKEERLKRQEAEKRAEDRQSLLEQRLQLLADRVAKPKEEAKPVTIEENPVEVLRQTRQELQQVQQLQVHQAQRVQFANHVAAQVNQFRARTPDYMDAYNFGVESTRQELKARGFSEEQIPGILENGEFHLAQEALEKGRNPGQHFYDFAVSRGYRKPEPVVQAQPVQQQVPDKLATIEKGQQAARSLGSMGGGAAPRKTLETLVSMSEKELAALPDEEIERILRGA